MDASSPERPRPSGALALGVWLASRSALAKVSLVVAAAGALAATGAAFGMRGAKTLETLPEIASLGLAWGAGTTLAVGASLQALRHDREQGITALARARGVRKTAYAGGRVAGLVVVLVLAVGGGTLVVGLAATAAAVGDASTVTRAAAAAIAYAVAFAMTMGPLAMAALGGSTRGAGYLALMLVLVLPEMLAPWTKELLPPGWRELTSLPAALDAVRAGVRSGGPAIAHAARAALALVAVVTASLMVVRANSAEVASKTDHA